MTLLTPFAVRGQLAHAIVNVSTALATTHANLVRDVRVLVKFCPNSRLGAYEIRVPQG
jgi:hypothetical protein